MLTLRVATVLALCGLGVSAAPVPKDVPNRETYYYPIKVGTKWVYDCQGDDIILVVTEVKDIKGGKQVTVERRDLAETIAQEVMEVSGSGLVQVAGPGGESDPPAVILRVPFRAGDKWKFKWEESRVRAGNEGTHTVVGVEKVKVPAGTFEAVRVDTDVTSVTRGEATRGKVSNWYAPNIGMVKRENDGTATWVLKSFTPPKE